MHRGNLHPWILEPQEAIAIQAALREQLVLTWDGRAVTRIGGVDVGLAGDVARAAVVILRYPDLTLLESVTAQAPLVFPYVPGLLAFREGPAVLAAWEKLQTRPDVVLFDGQGIAHPRGLGIASHLGLWLECPTIGVAKSRLYGRHVEPGPQRGDYAELYDERSPGQVIGVALRTRARVRPVYVSPGHLIDLPHAIEFVLRCCAGYRLPEPTRWAHQVAARRDL